MDALSQIKASADSKFGDYQFNGSMGLAKEAKVSPRKVAEKIVESADALICDNASTEAKPALLNASSIYFEINTGKFMIGLVFQ